ncbi:MAG: 30S ribosomal protein S8 [Candidatus Altiarchaeota archaeon]
MMQDLINDAIVNIKNYERIGKAECTLKPTSKLLIEILRVFQKEGYIGEFELSDATSGGTITVKLTQRINECGVIKPRFAVKTDEYDKWEKRFLPARDIGILVVSTPRGIMDHREAKKRGLGGRLLTYVY